MGLAELFKIIFDNIDKNVKTFKQQESAIAQTNKKLKSAKDELHGGKGWVGDAATEFFRKFDSEYMPAMKRLEKAMDEGGRVAGQVNKIMQQAEGEWKVTFKLTIS